MKNKFLKINRPSKKKKKRKPNPIICLFKMTETGSEIKSTQLHQELKSQALVHMTIKIQCKIKLKK